MTKEVDRRTATTIPQIKEAEDVTRLRTVSSGTRGASPKTEGIIALGTSFSEGIRVADQRRGV